MKNAGFCLKTDTLTITPSNMDDMWESDWIIAFRKGEKEQLGTATFAGVKRLGTVPLYVELRPEYRNRGLGTEIIRMLVNWAFLHKNIFEVVSRAEHENDKGINALEKAGFVYRGSEGEVETYSIIKAKTTWTGVYVIVGILNGMLLGVVFNNLWMGFLVGIVVSLCIGEIMDNKALKYRESITGKSERTVRRPGRSVEK